MATQPEDQTAILRWHPLLMKWFATKATQTEDQTAKQDDTQTAKQDDTGATHSHAEDNAKTPRRYEATPGNEATPGDQTTPGCQAASSYEPGYEHREAPGLYSPASPRSTSSDATALDRIIEHGP